MTKRLKLGLAAVIAVLAIVASFLAYRKWHAPSDNPRNELLASMPADSSAVFFADLDALRHAQFFSALLSWAPQPQLDPEYAQFLRETGFDYERDLARVAIAVEKRGADNVFFFVADGRFNRKKILDYASKFGACSTLKNHQICSTAVQSSPGKISFCFWNDARIALVSDSRLSDLLGGPQKNTDPREWNTRFERLAGSPVFAVIRQDASIGAALAAQTPGGLRSPQLSSLIDQLQWITFAGIPESDRLRVVVEGESPFDATARQLADLLNGVVLLAQAGLNDVQTRKQLDPATRDAWLELLNGADISKLDRGDSKAVRVVFDLTPKFLEAATSAPPAAPPGATTSKPLHGNTSGSKKGHI